MGFLWAVANLVLLIDIVRFDFVSRGLLGSETEEVVRGPHHPEGEGSHGQNCRVAQVGY